MKLIDVNIPNYGMIKGRDSLNIVEMKSLNPRTIELILSLHTGIKNKYKYLKIIFVGVILYKVFDENIRGLLTEEEFDMHAKSNAESVFMEVEDSNLVKKNIGVYGNENLRHLIIETYDFKIESLCENVIIEDFKVC